MWSLNNYDITSLISLTLLDHVDSFGLLWLFYTQTSLFQNASIDDDDDWADFGGFEVKSTLSLRVK